jgi:hypothetical protein
MTNIEAAALLGQILSTGMTKAAVARELGRDSGLITQVERGTKGASYVPALTALRDRLAGRRELSPTERLDVQKMVPQRRTKAGAAARVRQKASVVKGRNQMGRAGRQAVRSGAIVPGKVVEGAAADKGGRGRIWLTVDVSNVDFPELDEGSPVTKAAARNAKLHGPTTRHTYGGRNGMPAAMWAGRMQAAGGNMAVAVERWINDGMPGAGGLDVADWRAHGEGDATFPELVGNAASADVTYVEVRSSTV